MVFKCQEDSYLQTFTSSVVSCKAVDAKVENEKGKLEKKKGFEVELEDTILFPEGGGQPDDRGLLNDVSVLKCYRKGDKAFHFVETELATGTEVKIAIDWRRRFDHMQQHSGQHLITAVIDTKFGYKTTSWDLGKTMSFIELDTPKMTKEEIIEAEREINESIRLQRKVTVHVTQLGSELLESVRTRGLPADHVGDVRIIEIDGIEANMCCGTHVSNLSHLQCIKLLYADKGKKGKTNLYFLAGDRVLSYIEKRVEIEKDLTKQLKCGPDLYSTNLEKSLKQLKLSQKNCTIFLREIAIVEAERIKREITEQNKKVFRLHRREGNNEFMNIISNGVNNKEVFLFLSVGEDKGSGMFHLSAPEDFLKENKDTILDAITAKGAVKGNVLQGKAEKLQKCSVVEQLILDFVQNSSS